MNEILYELILVVTASYVGAIGYGDLYECQIRKIIAGTINESSIRLSILAGDKEKSDFLSSHLYPMEVEIGFAIIRKDEPYRLAPISGFVDKDKASWEIKYMREAQGPG